jgi:hypothetical protein
MGLRRTEVFLLTYVTYTSRSDAQRNAQPSLLAIGLKRVVRQEISERLLFLSVGTTK